MADKNKNNVDDDVSVTNERSNDVNVLEKLAKLEKELAKMKKLKKRKSRKRKRRPSFSDENSDDSSANNNYSNDYKNVTSHAGISLLNENLAYAKPFVSPLKIKTNSLQQHSPANTQQHSPANSKQPSPAYTRQLSPAITHQSTADASNDKGVSTSNSKVDFVALPITPDHNLGETVSLLPTDDNLTEDERNVILTEGVELPYVKDDFGPPIDPKLCGIVKNTWEKKYIYHEMKPIWDKYLIPSNLKDSLVAPEMNDEVKKLLLKWQLDYDRKWTAIQKSLLKCVSGTPHLNSIVSSSDVPQEHKTAALQTNVQRISSKLM